MRLKITLEAKGGTRSLPLDYKHGLARAIYHLIGLADKNYQQFLHTTGYGKRSQGFKYFTLSNFIESLYYHSGRLHLGQRDDYQVSFYFHSYLPQTVKYLEQQLMEGPSIKICAGQDAKTSEFRVIGIERLPVYTADTITFTTLSPIVVSTYYTKGKEQYLHPYDEDFKAAFLKNLMHKYQVIKTTPLGSELPNISEAPKMSVTVGGLPKEKLHQIKETRFKGYENFEFTLSGHPEILKLGYLAGFGKKNSMGFGCCKIVLA